MTQASVNAPSLETRAIWAIAIPAMLTNVATALIGIGDMWIVGRLEDAATQGAVDVGARLFAVLFTVINCSRVDWPSGWLSPCCCCCSSRC